MNTVLCGKNVMRVQISSECTVADCTNMNYVLHFQIMFCAVANKTAYHMQVLYEG